MGRGLTAVRPGRVGESGLLAVPPSGCRLESCNLSFGLILGTAGGSRGAEEDDAAASRRWSGLGAGETGWMGGIPVGVSPGLFIFSNLARNDDTGF